MATSSASATSPSGISPRYRCAKAKERYRTLVEHAPEAIVVFDVDGGKFVDVNDNACRFFKMSRAALLASGPDKISPPLQADGTASFGVARGYIDGALAGEVPVFEWVALRFGRSEFSL